MPAIHGSNGYDLAKIVVDNDTNGDTTTGHMDIYTSYGGTTVKAARFDNGTISVGTGTNILYRCTVAGALRVGQTTTVSADCGTAVDTGLRVQ